MGTSAKNTGPTGESALVPSWLESTDETEGQAELRQGSQSERDGQDTEGNEENNEKENIQDGGDHKRETKEKEKTEEKDGANTPLPPLPALPAPSGNPFRSATTRLNRAARSGIGNGGGNIRRSVSDYVKGHGGGGGVSRRVANSLKVAGNIVGFAREASRQGFEAAVRQFGLQELSGKPIEEASGMLIDAFTGPGVTTDDNIAREAWCDTVEGLVDTGIIDFAALTPEQWAQAVETFLAKAIELRIFNDVGNAIVGISPNIAKIQEIENDITIIVREGIQGQISPLIKDGAARSTAELQQCVNLIVSQGCDYIEQIGENEEEE